MPLPKKLKNDYTLQTNEKLQRTNKTSGGRKGMAGDGDMDTSCGPQCPLLSILIFHISN